MRTWPENKVGERVISPLSDRLSAIAESLPRGGVICDVGSDHGDLARYLLEKDYCREAIVTDLNTKPLCRAEANLKEVGVDHRAKFLLTDGIVEVLPLVPDAFVIAGMGGETISGILSHGLDLIRKGTHFALQPMSKARHLRRFLYENGFRMEREQAIFENGKIFLIFHATYDGIQRRKDESFYAIGEYLPFLKGEAIYTYWRQCYEKQLLKNEGKKKAGVLLESDLRDADMYRERLEWLDENS